MLELAQRAASFSSGRLSGEVQLLISKKALPPVHDDRQQRLTQFKING